MNFLEAVEACNNGNYVRRSVWIDGLAMFIARPKDRNNKKYRWSSESCGDDYIATCYVASCELGGVKTLDDILATGWELFYK